MLSKPSVIQENILMSFNFNGISSRAGFETCWAGKMNQREEWGEMYVYGCHRVNVN